MHISATFHDEQSKQGFMREKRRKGKNGGKREKMGKKKVKANIRNKKEKCSQSQSSAHEHEPNANLILKMSCQYVANQS